MYEALLKRLDPGSVLQDALDLVYKKALRRGYSDEEAGKVVPVLLCWESPGDFCHRRMIAKWIEEEKGVKARAAALSRPSFETP